MGFRAGVVAVVGRPNTGKSTLVNALVGQKVSIVSDKPQTTRRAIRGIRNRPGSQIVLTDTPGMHRARTQLGSRLNRAVERSREGVDAVLQVVDAAAGIGAGDAFVGRLVAPFDGPRVCAVNKIDRLRGHAVVPALAAAAGLAEFDHVVPVSALKGAGVEELATAIVSVLPEGEPLFAQDEVTDTPLEIRIAEIVREKALALTREEVPHSVAVRVEELERRPGGAWAISCAIMVERDSQKGILVGRGGSMLREIGSRARPEIQGLVGATVHLDARVRVLGDWQRDPRALDRLGL